MDFIDFTSKVPTGILANEVNKYVFYLVSVISVRIKMNNFWFLLSEEFVCLDRKKK